MHRLVPGLVALALLSSTACKRDRRTNEPEGNADPNGSSYDSPTPTPAQVCTHLAEMIAIELGGVDPQVQAETIATCTADMISEQQMRGPEGWDAVSRCVMAAHDEADIDRCDELYPASGRSQPPNNASGATREDQVCLVMVSTIAVELMAEAEAAGEPPPQLSDDEIVNAHVECLRSLEKARESRAGADYDRLLDCLGSADSTAAMDQCLTRP